MKQILAITRKEILLWIQKPGAWLLVFVLPLVFTAIIQAVFGSSGTPVVTVFAVNQDKDGKAAIRVMDALRDAPNLKIEELKTREEADRRVGAGELMAAVVVPEGFSSALTTPEGAKVEIIVDPARAQQASIVTGLVNAALGPLIVDAEVNRGVESGVAQAMQLLDTNNALTPTPPPEASGRVPTPQPNAMQKFFTAAMKGVVSSQVQDALDNPQVRLDLQPVLAQGVDASAVRTPSLLDYLVPGYSLMFLFFLVSYLAITVIEERESGTLRRLLVAPLPRSRILLGKMLPYFLIAVVQMIVVFAFSTLLFGINLGHSVLGLGLIIVASALAMASLGILVAALARTAGQADGLASVLVLAMAVVSGAMFPGIQIPVVQYFTPHYWSMQGFLNIIARGMGAQGAFLPVAILLIMSAVFFIIGVIRFRFE